MNKTTFSDIFFIHDMKFKKHLDMLERDLEILIVVVGWGHSTQF